ncbi:MAG TPA: hypothetical protein VEI73_00835 [Candidatus Acidoferrum sp.]|nr:hypothetical protein [Candidatus Acidoferrum sp.]
MALGADDGPDYFDFAGFADEERAADDAHESAAHEELFLPSAEGFNGFVVGIAEKREIEFVLLLEGRQGFDGVGAHAEDSDFELIELLFCVTKLGRLDDSTGGIGFGIEKEEDALALEIFKRDGGAIVGGEAEGGGFVAWFEHGDEVKEV